MQGTMGFYCRLAFMSSINAFIVSDLPRNSMPSFARAFELSKMVPYLAVFPLPGIPLCVVKPGIESSLMTSSVECEVRSYSEVNEGIACLQKSCGTHWYAWMRNRSFDASGFSSASTCACAQSRTPTTVFCRSATSSTDLLNTQSTNKALLMLNFADVNGS